MAGAFAFIGCMTTIEYEEIVQRMRPRLVKLGGTFFRNDEQAADAVQEALLPLWLLRERVNDEDYAEALLIRMTKNVCVSEWRRRQKHGMMSIEESSRILSDEGQPWLTMTTNDSCKRPSAHSRPRNSNSSECVRKWEWTYRRSLPSQGCCLARSVTW